MAELDTKAQPWVFTQSGPPFKTVTFEGESAPHGRRRHQPITDNEFELRLTEVYYPGVRRPTWLHFGDKESPLVLRGRFMDRVLGPRGARSKLYEVKALVSDGVECLLRWGSTMSYIVMPARLRHAREDASEIAWELTLHVGEDNDLVQGVGMSAPPLGPTEVMATIADKEPAITKWPRIDFNLDVLSDFQDVIADLISTVNTASATLLHAADAVQDFESAGAADIQRLLGGINQYRTALLTLVGVMDNVQLDGILINRTAQNITAWLQTVAEADLSALEISQLLSDLELDGARALQGRSSIIQHTYTARDGDSWESIASTFLGGPDSAPLLRAANGIRYGEKPQPGRSYLIPNG